MALNDNDLQAVLTVLRESLRSAGFGALDERVIQHVVIAQSAFGRLEFYIKLLTEELALGSDGQVARTLRQLRFVETEEGDPVAGIRLVLSEREAAQYQTSYIDFGGTPELTEIVMEFHAILEEIRKGNSGDPPRRQPAKR